MTTSDWTFRGCMRCWCILIVCFAACSNVLSAQQACDPASDASCVNGAQATQQSENPPYHGPKQVIAVLPFENRVQGSYGNWELGDGLTGILVTELLKAGRFVLVEREKLKAIIKEQELGMTGLVREETASKAGLLSGAQFMIKGSVTEFNDEAGGGGLTIGYRLGEIGGKTRTAYVGIDVRIVDNLTGQIYASYNASATARSSGGSLAARFSSDDFKIGVSGFESTALGQAARDAIRQIVGFIVEESQHIPWQGFVIKADATKTYINRGATANLKVGDRLVVYYKGEPLIDPETGFNLGSEEERLCSVKLTKVQPKFSVARQQADCRGTTIERGYLVRLE